MESSIFDEKGIIQTRIYIFLAIQFTRNIPKDDKQHIPRTIV